MQKTIALLGLGVLIGIAADSAAAFDLKKLKAMAPAAQNAAPVGGDALVMQESVVRQYQQASLQIVTAQIELAKAFELKDQAAVLEAQAQALQSGPTLDTEGLEKQKSLSEQANTAIQARLDSGAQLSAEGRKHYVSSLVPYAAGVGLTLDLPPALKNFSAASKTQIQNASLLDKANLTMKLGPGLYLLRELPVHGVSLLGGLKNIVSYAQSNKIPVPADATAVLSRSEDFGDGES